MTDPVAPVLAPASGVRPAASGAPVVAVVVSRDGGDRLRECCAALDAQDHPRLRVLVLDVGEGDSAESTVADVAPRAVVRRLGSVSFAVAANRVAKLTEGAAFYLVCHDDVVPEPTAVRTLVEEALRSNAGIVGPKLVAVGNPRRLLDVGSSVDKTGALAPRVEPGELDQEQHDAVRDVFVVDAACLLVRADLFAALGGFDVDLDEIGAARDLCWRAHVAGARVLAVPSARVAHGEIGALDPDPADPDTVGREARARLHTMLVAYRPWHRWRVLPQAAVVALVEIIAALVTGRVRRAGALAGAWPAALRSQRGIRAARRRLEAVRTVPDREVRELQVPGFARLSDQLRGRGREDRLSGAAGVLRNAIAAMRDGSRRRSVAVWSLLLVLLAIGSRSLVTDGVPSVGELVPYADSPWTLLHQYVSGWTWLGLGGEGPASTGQALWGLAGLAMFGATGLARTALVIGPVLLGWIGIWRLTRPFDDERARIAALVVYAATPVAFNALAAGRWGALVAYAAMPWALARLCRAGRQVPFDPESGAARARPWWAEVAGLGVILAVVVAMVPSGVIVVGIAVVGMGVASLVVGGVGGWIRSAAVATGAVVVALALNLPYSADLLRPDAAWSPVASVALAGPEARGAPALLRFDTGPLGSSWVGLGLLALALFALLTARAWRSAWAVRGWCIALVAFGVALAGDQGWIDRPLPPIELLLVPAAAGLALAAGAGAAAVEADVRGSRLTWRQPLAAVALGLTAIGAIPTVAVVADGRLGLPRSDLERTVDAVTASPDDGGFRVLWLGDPRVMPVPGWWLSDGVAYALTDDGGPTTRHLWPGTPTRSTRLVPKALHLAAAGETGRLGRILGPMAVRYVVVVRQAAPAATGAVVHEPPADLLATLASQLDLRRIDLDDAITIYENQAWTPARARLSPGIAAAAGEAGFAPLIATDPSGSVAVLGEGTDVARSGEVPSPGPLSVAQAFSPRWHLDQQGRAAPEPAFGWAMSFDAAAGSGTLRYDSPLAARLAAGAQAVAWLVVLTIAWLGVSASTEASRRRAGRRPARASANAPAADDAAPLDAAGDLDDWGGR